MTITWSVTDEYSYAANGGSGTAPASGSGLDGTTISLASNTFTYPGYTFAGWSDGTTTYPAHDIYTLSSGGTPIVFAAQWTENPIDTVVLNSDGGAAVASLSGPDGSSITLPSDTYSGDVFDGWFTQASGGIQVGGAGSTYTIPAGGITLFAQWTGIAKFSPTNGPVGTVVTIKGTNLSGATKVTFNGVRGTITTDTATKIKVKVPVGATTGKIKVVTPGGKVKTATAFSVT